MNKWEWEQWAYNQGYTKVAGVDEVGRGPLAGPVIACACLLPAHHTISGISDSKQLSASERQKVFQQIRENSEVLFGIGVIEAERIDVINILQATFEAMRIALNALTVKPDFVLVDGKHPIPCLSLAQKAIIQGDFLSESIGAASIIAKEVRDQVMREAHLKWPEYGFADHKGYGTEAHRKAIRKYGPCPIHRKSFEPIKSLYLAEKESDLW